MYKCSKCLDTVNQFEKHINSCQILRYTKHKEEQLRFHSLKKAFYTKTLQDINKQLARNQKICNTTKVVIKD